MFSLVRPAALQIVDLVLFELWFPITKHGHMHIFPPSELQCRFLKTHHHALKMDLITFFFFNDLTIMLFYL